MKKFYITTPIYYSSGKPHIGHAFTTLCADVISRYKRKLGFDVMFVTGLDEHGSKIEKIAHNQKMEPQVFVDLIAQKYLALWKRLNIKYDNFIRTSSDQHKRIVKTLMNNLNSTPDVYADTYEGFYCTGCENFITEKDLIDGFCPNHLKKPQLIKEKNYFFNLKRYLPIIKEKILNNELKIVPENRKNEILAIIKEDIPNFSITRRKVRWGIPFPFFPDQTIYVWVDALMNYLTVLDFPQERFRKYWPADVQIIGAEINKFHSIYWPALLLSLKLPLPKEIFVHGLFTVNGQKMSKTLGNVIDPHIMINRFGADATRYLLLSQFPAYEHGDVKESEFEKKYNSDLVNGVGNLFERVLTLIINNKKGIIEDKIPPDRVITDLLRSTAMDYQQHMKDYELYNALKKVFSFIKELDIYINEKKPWLMQKSNDPKLDGVLSSLLYALKQITDWIEPFLPEKTKKIRTYIDNLKEQRDKLHLFPRL